MWFILLDDALIYSTLQEGRCSNQCRPVVCVDPERRCATLLVFGTHLAVIPFLQEYLLDDDIFSAKGLDSLLCLSVSLSLVLSNPNPGKFKVSFPVTQ